MPIDYSKYPPHWRDFSHEIRFTRNRACCECPGVCGSDHASHSVSGLCDAPNRAMIVRDAGNPARWWRAEDAPPAQFGGIEKIVRVVLTVAHTCVCEPLCAEHAHVLSLCQRCHLRLDADRHGRNAATTRRMRRIADQLVLF